MATRLMKNNPYIFEKFVLVKVNCKNSKDRYYFYSRNENIFYDQVTNLDIYNKGFRHETTTVSILHPHHVNKSIQMKEDGKGEAYNLWIVDGIPSEYIDGDGFIVILCFKR